jgi:hypothetical protein
MPRLDRVALLAAGLLLPACSALESGQVVQTAPAPMMPAVQVAKATNESDEPPLADILVASKQAPPRNLILPAHAESVVAEADVNPRGLEEVVPAGFSARQQTPAEGPLVAALRCYMNKSPEQAARCLQEMEQPDRELVAALLPLAVRIADGGLKSADPEDLATVVANMQAMCEPLRERAALDVPKLCFCRPKAAPAQFGSYELLEENHRFRPGELVGLYVEVRNFTSAPHGDDFRTQVRMTIEVHNDRHETVWRFDPPALNERSLSPRQDYCHVGRFALPANLPAGAYTLVLKVSDVPTNRTKERSLDFRVTTVKDVRSGGEG